MEPEPEVKFGTTRVVKCALEPLCKDTGLLERLRERAAQIDRLVTETYHLMHLDLRVRYEKAGGGLVTEPPWTKDRVMEFMQAVTTCQQQSGPERLHALRRQHYDPLRTTGLESRAGLPYSSLIECATKIAASIETNVRQHFAQHQRRYLKLRDGLLTNKEADERQSSINAQAAKDRAADLTCRDNSLPHFLGENTVGEDLQQHPERYLFVLWRYNIAFEEAGQHTVAVLPLSTGFVPGSSLHIDTQALETLVGKKDERARPYFAALDARREADREVGKKRRPPGRNDSVEALDEKDLLWSAFFNLDHVVSPSKVRKCRFGHHLTTDGISVSVTVLRPGKEDEQKKKKAKGKKSAPTNAKKKYAKKANIDTSHLNPSKVVGVDPGKIELVHMPNDTGKRQPGAEPAKTLRYTKNQRRHESGAAKREAHQRRIRTPEVEEAEQLLSDPINHSRAPFLAAFTQYLRNRFSVQGVLYGHYAANPIHRIFRWNNWRGRRSSEDRFVQRAVDTFGSDAVLAYGDASGWHSMPGIEATPTTGLKRRLAARFEVVATSEHRTSITCSNCFGYVDGDPTRTRLIIDRKDGSEKRVPVRLFIIYYYCLF